MAQGTILLVEDDFDLRSEIQRLLEEAGYRVVPAGNGADALLILQHSDPPDLILFDLMLPLLSGWEFSAEVSRDAKLARIPRIVPTDSLTIPPLWRLATTRRQTESNRSKKER